jgi:multidrug resistance protein, MATE family
MKISDYIPYYRRNLSLAYPLILSQIGQVTVSLIDNAMVGRVGTVELAASSFANNVFIIGLIFGMGITFGLTPLTGKAYGEGQLRKAAQWLKNAILTYQLASVAITMIMIGVYFLLPLFGQPEEVVAAARPYYLWLCASIFPFIAFFTFKQFFEGLGNTRMAMKITLISNVVNIVFNYVFIYGKLGFPELGLTGAGIGTFLARLVMPALFILFAGSNCRYRRYIILSHFQKINLKDIRRVLTIGLPIALQLIVEVSAFSIGAVMMGWLGVVELAAHQVAIGLATFTYMISVGISTASTIRVSHQMGARDFVSVRMAAYASAHLVLVFMSLMAIMFIILRHLLPYMFTSDPQVIALAVRLLIVAAVFQIFDGLQVVMLGILRGMADVRIPMVYAFVAYLCIGLPSSWLFAFPLGIGPEGIWLGYLTGLTVAGILFFKRFKRNLRSFEV